MAGADPSFQRPSKPGNVMITPVGHTASHTFGNTPDAKVVGRTTEPTALTFGK